MNIKTIGTLFVLFSLISGIGITQAYGDHSMASVSIPAGSNIQGCEETNECYIPYEVTVDKGGEVIWTNDDTAIHTVTSGSATNGTSGIFDSSIINAGAEFSYVPTEDGTFDYYCLVHPWMTGIVTVLAEGMDKHGDEHGDKHGDEHGDEYNKIIIPETIPAKMTSQDGNYMINVYPHAEPVANEMFTFTVVVTDSDNGETVHLNYDVMAMQDGQSILEESEIHAHQGMKEHMTSMLDSDSPVTVSITLQGFGEEIQEKSERTGPIGETIELNVVPEFGTIAILVLAVAIISIVAVTTKSRLSITPRL